MYRIHCEEKAYFFLLCKAYTAFDKGMYSFGRSNVIMKSLLEACGIVYTQKPNRGLHYFQFDEDVTRLTWDMIHDHAFDIDAFGRACQACTSRFNKFTIRLIDHDEGMVWLDVLGRLKHRVFVNISGRQLLLM